MAYHPATAQADHITNRLRIDANNCLEQLRVMSNSLRQDIPDILEQMRRLWREERDPEALKYIERYEHTMRELGALMTTLGTDHVELDTIGAEHRLHRFSEQIAREQRATPAEVTSSVPADFLADPITVD